MESFNYSDFVPNVEIFKQADNQTDKVINPLKFTQSLTGPESEFTTNELSINISPEITEPIWDFSDSIQSSRIPTNASNSLNSSRIQSPNSVSNPNHKYFNLSSSITVILDAYMLQKQQKRSETPEKISFIQQYIKNDVECIFDEYISQINGDNENQSNNKITKKHKLRINLKQIGSLNQSQVTILCSTGWNIGIHEWKFKILECDNNRQEMGVVSCSDIEDLKINTKGIRYTKGMGARAIYGISANVSGINSYYASYNTDSTERCYKDLSGNDKILWSIGDVIRICINLDQFRIKFYVNDIKIRKTLSLEMGYTYYPIVMFFGHCKYELISFD